MEPTHFESLYPESSRFEEIEKLLNFIKEGNSAQLIGLPGAGKSNVLGFLAYNRNIRIKHLGENQKWFHFVPLNFSEIRERNLADAWKFIFLGLIESLKERQSEDFEKINSIFKNLANLNDELILFQGLKSAIDYLCIEKELTVVFLFDRFEEYAKMADSSFFANLRTLRNRAKYRFSVIFPLSRSIENIVDENVISDFHEFLIGHEVYLKLEDKIGLDFRISYLAKVSGKKIDEKIKEKIIELTGGHGKLTRLCLENYLTEENTSADFFLEQKNIKGALFEIWNFLTPLEIKDIKTKNQNAFLEKVELLKDSAITIPLFEEFMTKNVNLHEKISLNKDTNEILKGEVPISNSLSSSEFKLLKFLITNKDRVVEKEEIINAVWSDSKTQAGVTDQALDQIVYRLRKKIEEDPNNPTHIQTVKGRGLKFTP